MPTSVHLQTEDGEVLEEAACDWPVAFLIPAGGFESTVCVRFIDDYGDTVFNRLQMPVLRKELEQAAAAVTPETIRIQYDAWHQRMVDAVGIAGGKGYEPPSLDAVRGCAEILIGMTHRCEAQVHTYMKFIGD